MAKVINKNRKALTVRHISTAQRRPLKHQTATQASLAKVHNFVLLTYLLHSFNGPYPMTTWVNPAPECQIILNSAAA